METCLNLSRWGKFISGFLSCVGRILARGGGELPQFVSGNGLKFFNRSPLTLKFEAEKLERESQARERERERERERASCYFMLVSCHSTLVSWHSILVSCHSTLVSCHSILVSCHSTLVSWRRAGIVIY